VQERELQKKYVTASVRETAFNCAHCGALASQQWYTSYIAGLENSPFIPDDDFIQKVLNDNEIDHAMKERLLDDAKKRNGGLVFIEKGAQNFSDRVASNLFLSQCFNCRKIAVWVHDRLVFPPELQGEEPNEDIPLDILQDFDEARSILNLSPRGAAALLRLAIQKLVKHLGEKGDNINDDIASLVRQGLSPLVQRSLDVVRVVGNEAVHPGTIDLRDNRDVASALFRLVNLIAEQMISHPKHVNDLYDNVVPDSKKQQITKRDAKKP
jgi:hypothetical protein